MADLAADRKKVSNDHSDVGVVEGAAGALNIAEIRSRAEQLLESPTWSGAMFARDVLALVADHEALLERIRELEQLLGGNAVARSGGMAEA